MLGFFHGIYKYLVAALGGVFLFFMFRNKYIDEGKHRAEQEALDGLLQDIKESKKIENDFVNVKHEDIQILDSRIIDNNTDFVWSSTEKTN